MNTDRPTPVSRGGEKVNRFSASGLWWGGLLIIGGALWLVDATDALSISPLVVAIFFALAGIGFAVDVARDPGSWWAAIPAGALLGLAALIALVESTTVADEWGASMLLAGGGLGFLAAYLRAREQWWTLIPAGVLASVAIIVASVPIVERGEGIAVVVLTLLAVILVVLALVPIRGSRMWWPLVPAGILGIVAAFLANDSVEALEAFDWVSPAALLVIGVFVVIRALSGRSAGRQDR